MCLFSINWVRLRSPIHVHPGVTHCIPGRWFFWPLVSAVALIAHTLKNTGWCSWFTYVTTMRISPYAGVIQLTTGQSGFAQFLCLHQGMFCRSPWWGGEGSQLRWCETYIGAALILRDGLWNFIFCSEITNWGMLAKADVRGFWVAMFIDCTGLFYLVSLLHYNQPFVCVSLTLSFSTAESPQLIFDFCMWSAWQSGRILSVSGGHSVLVWFLLGPGPVLLLFRCCFLWRNAILAGGFAGRLVSCLFWLFAVWPFTATFSLVQLRLEVSIDSIQFVFVAYTDYSYRTEPQSYLAGSLALAPVFVLGASLSVRAFSFPPSFWWLVFLVLPCGCPPSLSPPPLAHGGAGSWFSGIPPLLSPLGYLVVVATAWASGLSVMPHDLYFVRSCAVTGWSGDWVCPVSSLHRAAWQQRLWPCVGHGPLHHAAPVVLVPGFPLLSWLLHHAWPHVTTPDAVRPNTETRKNM